MASRGRGGPGLDVLSPGEDATVSLGRPQKSYPYGATATIPVTLDARSERRTLQTWVASYGGSYLPGAEVEVAEGGTGTVSVRLKSRSSLLVGYDAVDTSESDRDTVSLWVRPRLTLEFPKATGTRRPTYAAGSNARIAVEVKGRPACVRLHVDQRIGGRWKRIHRSDCEPPRRKHVSTTLRWKPSLAGRSCGCGPPRRRTASGRPSARRSSRSASADPLAAPGPSVLLPDGQALGAGTSTLRFIRSRAVCRSSGESKAVVTSSSRRLHHVGSSEKTLLPK